MTRAAVIVAGALLLAARAAPAGAQGGPPLPPAPATARPTPSIRMIGSALADSTDVAATVDRFHQALESGDSATVMRLLADDVVILESGSTETRAEYAAGHLAADISFARGTRAARSPIRALVRGDVAWATMTDRTRGSYHGRPVDSEGAELMVLARTGAGWRVRAIHWSSHARRQ